VSQDEEKDSLDYAIEFMLAGAVALIFLIALGFMIGGTRLYGWIFLTVLACSFGVSPTIFLSQVVTMTPLVEII